MDVFLFPLVNVTLFPRTTKPLHIFEARYVQMVQRAVETSTPLVLGFIPDPSMVGPVHVGQEVSFVHQVAGFGSVQIVEERPNGTMLIFVEGLGKCRLGKVKSAQPYIACESEVLKDDLNVSPAALTQVQTLRKIVERWIGSHVADEEQRNLFLRKLNGPEEIVGAFASYLIRDYDLQQLVLEYSSLNEQIDYLYRLAGSGEITG